MRGALAAPAEPDDNDEAVNSAASQVTAFKAARANVAAAEDECEESENRWGRAEEETEAEGRDGVFVFVNVDVIISSLNPTQRPPLLPAAAARRLLVEEKDDSLGGWGGAA